VLDAEGQLIPESLEQPTDPVGMERADSILGAQVTRSPKGAAPQTRQPPKPVNSRSSSS
jgi:hypothetical protein